METNELLLHLTKKLESGELKILIGEKTDHINIFLDENDKGNSLKIAVIMKKLNKSYVQIVEANLFYEPSWNDEFKEKFYRKR